MCRSTDYHRYLSYSRDCRLRIRAFFVQFSGLNARIPLPASVTLLYLPRINENALDVDGVSIRPGSPVFVTLHRVVTAKTRDGEAVFGSRERVRASEGVRFEVYLREEKVLKGIFRKDEGDEWKLECKCAVEVGEVEVSEAEVCVAVEGHVAMNERVEIVARRRKNKSRGCGWLEEIPEEREEEDTTHESYGCWCSCGEEEISGWDGGEVGEKWGEEDSSKLVGMEKEMEGVRWAVDVGIWAMCLGVGFLVSKASARRLRRGKIF
ncbi:hypothetical protein I3843_11G111600 [Carya illinoinensis]|uniref:Uncharacterized protein n=1 Tax=Carya illinoinensis TaxID=32201 RepID=A0A8T1P184_CARIL|nr:uncharacterized protein LOC122280907 [Carya illinoinensis]KAG2680706.1 hypothetical protein I3760_11G110900 [Carya illinoinensis]KAG6636465.1 hypothetical protein CIPAW_11G113300 [Carya illinoinensis]KAG6688197.1 hypothetical protein I3842_11G112600 [Carya illinoinensis]KAG7956168.1 hypothetical protein I3843_11G111600 [Carya illinoinensis]